MTMVKDLIVDELTHGDFLVLDLQSKTAKNGSSYLSLRIGDRTGEVPMKIWDYRPAAFPDLSLGKAIRLQGASVRSFNGAIQIELDGKNSAVLQVLEKDAVEYDRFLPAAPDHPDFYWGILDQSRARIADCSLASLLSAFFNDKEFRKEFARVPAALRRHHVYIGGLLEHTVSVLQLVLAAADHYPGINRDLLITGAILHDIGKMRTYRVGAGFEGTDEGRLIGHLILGTQMVREKIQGLRSTGQTFSEGDEGLLLHLLISHHGIMEWGSPVEPLLIEACILHHADNFDAEVNKFQTIMRQHEGAEDAWAPYDSNLGRSIYLNRALQTADDSSV